MMKIFKRIPLCFYNISVQVFGFTLVYYMLFTRDLFAKKIVIGGDTQLLWSYCYAFYRSLVDYGEFSWWDPTTLNGWPAYVQFTAGWYNFLNPLVLPVVIFNYIAIKFFGVSVNGAIVFQKTLYPFVLTLIAVILISREVIKNKVARLFPPLVFSLCEIQFHFLRDSFLFEGFPAAIFYIYALIRYFNNRTSFNLALYVLFTGIFISSFCYSFFQAYLYWIGIFTVILCLFNKDFVVDTYNIICKLFNTKKGRWYLFLSICYLSTAVIAFFSTVYFNMNNVFRASGSGSPIDYLFGTDYLGTGGIYHLQSWTNILTWMPFEDVEKIILKTDVFGGGSDHRYIGLATIPLILVALLRGYKNRFTLPLFLTSALCLLFLIYTIHNVILNFLVNTFDLFKNIRVLANLLPRDGPSLFLIILAGIGLDTLLTSQKDKNKTIEQLLQWLLLALLFVSGICVIPLFSDKFKGVIHSLGHISIYLSLFTLFCIVLNSHREESKLKTQVAVVFLFSVFVDLSLSYSHYWERGRVWFLNQGPHTLPTIEKITPIADESQSWPGQYRGMTHNLFGDGSPFTGPFFGMRTWLVLVTRDKWKPVLENYNPVTRRMKAYPDFRFYSTGKNIPFDSIYQIDQIRTPKEAGIGLYLHDENAVLKDNKIAGAPEATYTLEKFTFNKVKIKTKTSQELYLLFLDNYDPFWTAKIDGLSVPIYKANFTFKAIILPKGEHVIEWTFNPYPIKITWILFYIIFFINLFFLYKIYKKRNTV